MSTACIQALCNDQKYIDYGYSAPSGGAEARNSSLTEMREPHPLAIRPKTQWWTKDLYKANILARVVACINFKLICCIGRAIVFCFALSSVLVAFTRVAFSMPAFFEIKDRAPKRIIDKYNYLIKPIANGRGDVTIRYEKIAYLNILRVESADLCSRAKCLTYIINDCSGEQCQYSAVVAERRFFISDYQSNPLPKTVAIQFISSKSTGGIVVLAGSGFIAAEVE